ncbi:glycosyltransferase family 4 protein [Hydrocarboniclastica marina]|uniref:Glycosyltransferase n=1 Tax=Hydrocarboniclastica marina TaxID=2259620 RepID=A0A4P7XIU9_9ALTE|nr:glycosyltransferase [Hydrocarboniclastica marina]MAM00601.1 glycosyl transferase family 1 [Alteromonadaceae bacterium]QCF26464.1 glycosyltransferase [Hydrocarboniclastica marina]
MKQVERVLHVITGLGDGGAEGVLARLCLNSRAVRHSVVSLTDEGKYGSMLRESGIKVHCLGMRPGKPSLVSFVRLAALIRNNEPDLVQTWMYHADLFGGLAARFAGVKRVFWGVRHSTLDKNKTKRSTRWVARLCASISSWVPEKIVCCAKKALIVHAELGYAEHKLIVIPNGYDLSQFAPNAEAGYGVRESLGIKRTEFLIGKVGRFDPFKDHDNLLRALALLKKASVDFRCVLVGTGLDIQNATLVKLLDELDLKGKVILAGQRNDIPAVMNALDLHVLASSAEGFPNVLAEAMACGTPCVTTRVGDALDIIGDESLSCSPGDSLGLSELIKHMHYKWAECPKDWAEYESKCVQRIQARFSLASMVSAYENCWRSQSVTSLPDA